ncbi:uncharacterized protein LOC125491819 [Beta vulgaris subsp. vulgaris]|uniref:uncharacterized protein LOC125491819 n=1 Tax=Beta vulgaris subsp. vulgaris TaxID=3555 RepID=UPI002036E535|nr:uncharacterized protein LOC125491819 [Beta vulgaris subsp. vulgaris]
MLNDTVERVRWKRLICNNYATPKSKFILWMVLHNRLPTVDRIRRWGVNCEARCSLCRNEEETIQHLFFSCAYAAGIWRDICRLMNFTDAGGIYQDVISSVCSQARKKKGKLFVMFFTECVYAIWRQRNNKIFKGNYKDANVVLRDIFFTVANRSNDVERSKLLM